MSFCFDTANIAIILQSTKYRSPAPHRYSALFDMPMFQGDAMTKSAENLRIKF